MRRGSWIRLLAQSLISLISLISLTSQHLTAARETPGGGNVCAQWGEQCEPAVRVRTFCERRGKLPHPEDVHRFLRCVEPGAHACACTCRHQHHVYDVVRQRCQRPVRIDGDPFVATSPSPYAIASDGDVAPLPKDVAQLSLNGERVLRPLRYHSDTDRSNFGGYDVISARPEAARAHRAFPSTSPQSPPFRFRFPVWAITFLALVLTISLISIVVVLY